LEIRFCTLIILLVISCKKAAVTYLTIDNKKYVIVPEENYQELQRIAALKREPEKTLSIKEAREYSKSLIRKWVSEK
jgi:predicted P-loop ATPase/GTPase